MSNLYNEKLNEFLHPRLRSLLVGYVRLVTGAQQPTASSQVPSPSPSSKMASTSSSSPFTSVVSPLANAYDRFSQWRTALGLSSPGTVENLTKEVKCELRFPRIITTPLPTLPPPRDVSFHTSPARWNLVELATEYLPQLPTLPTFSSTVPGPISRKTSRSRRCSKSPTLSRWLRKRHLRHITLEPCLRTTRLVTLGCYLRPSLTWCQVLLTGNVDSEGNVNGRFNHGWTPASVTKVQAQVWTIVDSATRVYANIAFS